MHLFTRLIVILLCLTLSVHSAWGQVVAGFTATPTSGCAPLVVAFTNTSTPTAGTTYVWNMGNGSGPVTLTHPGASYLTAGTYTVTLTASNSGFTSTFSRVVTVYPSPVVQFNVNDTLVCPGEAVTFTTTTVGGVPGPVTYLWSSGDGYTSTNATYTHAYGYPGYFNVTLNATNANGCLSTLTRPALVHVLTPPVPAFSASTRHICNSSGSVIFTGFPTGAGPFTYRWIFGDGSAASTLPSPTHFYASPGSYTVKQIVTDSRGCKDSVSIPNYITVSNLQAAFTGPDSACVNANVAFINTSTGHISSQWFYGNGGSSYGTNGSNLYNARGAYTVTLVVADSFCFDTISHPILIPAHAVSFNITPDTACPAPVVASFAASVPPGSSVIWYFGDGYTGAGINTTHTYLQSNFYTVQMVSTSAMGCRDTAAQQVYEIYDLLFSLYYPPLFLKGGCIPLTVSFITSAESSFPIPPPSAPLFGYPHPISYSFDFGDGSTFDTTILSRNLRAKYTKKHTYYAVGVYPVTVTIVTANGCTDTVRDTIRAGTPHQATFTATPRRQCYHNNQISFTRTVVTPPIESYMWLFGDNVSSVIDTVNEDPHTVLHHFEYPGIFSDTLISFSNGCPDTFIRKDYITIDSPKALPQVQIVCSLANTARFKGDYSIGADTYLWIFGDGTTSTLANPQHTFPSPTNYVVKLTVYNIASGCHDTMQTNVNLGKPVITFSASDTVICANDYVVLTATPPPPGHIIYYSWYAAGNFDYLYNSIATDTFHTPGNYTVRLVIRDENGCLDTITRTNYIKVSKPSAHFTASPTTFCGPRAVVFTDSSTAWPGTSITNYSWAFGDGGTAGSGLPSVTHTYLNAGVYNITEIITDNAGCKDTVSRAIVTVFRPRATFAPSATNACAPATISFTNTSTPSSATYQWKFGDGGTSTLKNPTHLYGDTGRYTVKLIVTDTYGCKDSITYVNLITLSKPRASFNMDDSVSVCPPFTVRFTNTSTGGISNYWLFGNGNSSAVPHPTNIYTVPGYDTVNLIVTDVRGCKDTATRHVKVYGYSGAFKYSTDSGCAPLRVFFDADLSNISLASSITWDFADGVVVVSTLSDTISHQYLLPGAFVPKLILSDHVGCSSSSRGIDTIRVNEIRPGFTITPNPVCIRNPVNLRDTSTSYWSTITGRNWTYNGTASTLVSPVVTYTATGTYPIVLRATDGWGCTAADTENVTVYSLPDITVLPDSIICTGGTTVLYDSATGGIWSSGNSAIAIIGTGTGVVTGITAGAVSMTYTVGGTCYTTTTVTVNFFPDPGVITGDDGVCVGDTMTLADTATGGVWSSYNGNATITAAGLLTGVTVGIDTIRYTVTNVNCPSVARKAITVYPLPDAGIITGQNTLCREAVMTLTESNTGGRWGISDTAIATIDSVSGRVTTVGLGTATVTYTTIADANGCVNFVTYPLSVINPDFTITSNIVPVKCNGGSDGSINISVNGGTPPFQFLWSNGSSFDKIENLDTGVYTVRILEPTRQCALKDSFYVPAPDSIRITTIIDNDVCFHPNGRISIAATGGTGPYLYYWSNKGTGNEISGLAAGVYKGFLTDVNGCLFNYSILLEDSSCPQIVIYNAISPNGDGINDTWIIEGLQHYPGSTVAVFDKFGDKIFEKTDYKNDWGGTTGKGSMPDGTFYYLVKLNSDNVPDGKNTFTGSLLIKR